MTITGDADRESMELAVHGRWSPPVATELRTGIHKCLAEHPAALLIDLHDLGDPQGHSAPMWLAAYHAGTIPEPPVRLALCVPPATMLAGRLRRIGVSHFLPMYASMPEARSALARSLPVPDHLQLFLPPEPASARRAGVLVEEACAAWHLTPLVHAARTIICELVTNAVEHAATGIHVMVSRRGTGLYVSVRDGDPRLPRLPDTLPAGTGMPGEGMGLRIVHAAASAWGARSVGGGKVVWATVRASAP
ncbi:ATP-binding protein [Actinoplanes sp. NPDC049681]|uniref:ATP-binding protein n=1 Tax=Actinoplanes sp. NPDC049681 TaxID=3363905 RepID=UPI00379F5646